MIQRTVHEKRLRSCHPCLPASCKLLNKLSQQNVSVAQLTDHKQDAKYSESQSELRLFISRPSASVKSLGIAKPMLFIGPAHTK